ncbi:MAG: FliM/FliN family flagellar motor switch protein [Myxococcota bacterium]
MSGDPTFLFEIPVELVVELGRTELTVGELADLGQDDIVKLDCLAGQPLDIVAGGKLFGRGEVVIEEDRVGVRITELVGQDQADGHVLAEAG